MIIAFLLFSFFRYANSVYSLPVPAHNNNDTFPVPSGLFDSSQSAQNHRTALDILWSCYATTLSCTWAAVHPNMSFFEDNGWLLGSRVGRRSCLVFLALLMPEIVVAWSYAQLSSARRIKCDIDEILKKSGDECLWTVTHSHFLQMGGFRLRCTKDMVDKYKLYFHNEDSDHEDWDGAVTPRTFMKLLEEKKIKFPIVKTEALINRGKMDGFLKLFTILQLLWFSIQIFARVNNHLEVTLIEITTTALVTNSIFMYCFWLSKPFDASTPEYLCLVRDPGLRNTSLSRTDRSRAAVRNSSTKAGPVQEWSNVADHSGDAIANSVPSTSVSNADNGRSGCPKLEPDSRADDEAGTGRHVGDKEGVDPGSSPHEANAKSQGSLSYTRSALGRIYADLKESIPEALRRKLHLSLRRPSWGESLAIVPVACAVILALSLGLALLVVLVVSASLSALVIFPVYLAEVICHIPLFFATLDIKALKISDTVPTSERVTKMGVSFARKATTMFYVEPYKDVYLASILVGVIFGIIFGSIHFCALGSSFPSRGEYITWIIASGYTLLPFVGLIVNWIWAWILKVGGYLTQGWKAFSGFTSIHRIGSWFGQYISNLGRWLKRSLEYSRDRLMHRIWPRRCKLFWRLKVGFGERGPGESYKASFYILILSRVCIIGLSIASLRLLSASALSTVTWVNHVPHV